MEEKHIVAIEFGSSKLRGALGVIDKNDTLNVVAIQEEPHTEGVSYGMIRNVEEVASKIESICRKLANHASVKPRKINSVYVGLSGRSLGSVSKTVEQPLGAEMEIEAVTIGQLTNMASQPSSDSREILEVLPREYVVDNRVVPNPVGTLGSNIKATYSVIEASPSLKKAIDRVLPERLGLSINRYIISPLAQADAVLHDEEKQLGCVFVDFGAETTTVAIYKGGVLRYLATLPLGSRNITRDLMSLNILEDKAEQVKRTSGNAISQNLPAQKMNLKESLDLNEVNKYVAARASEIVANIMAQVEYAELKPTDLPAGYILVGGGSNLHGFSELLANKSHQKVRKGEIAPSKVRVTDTSIQSSGVLDVVSLLIAAASGEPVECFEAIATENPHLIINDTRQHNPHAGDKNRFDSINDDDNESRIGRLYDEDERDVFDPDQPVKEKKPKKVKEPKEPKKAKQPKEQKKTGGFLASLRSRIIDIITDDGESTEYDDSDDYDDSDED